MSNKQQISRRGFLQASSIAAVGTGLLPRGAKADTFPNKTISFVVPDSGGGSFDAYVRKFSEYLPQFLPHKVNVEPVPIPGAGGQAAAFQIQNAPPDGYFFGMLNVPGIFTSKFGKKPSKTDLDRLTWVANLGREGYGLAVSKDSPIQNIADMQKIAATRPITFSSTGSGSTDNFATRVFSASLGINFRIVTGYTGSAPTMVAVARGDVDATVHSLATLQGMAKTGLIRIIFSFQPNSGIAGIDDAISVGAPTLSEIYQWRPVVAPPNLPQPILQILSDALVNTANTQGVKDWAQAAGTSIFPLDYRGVNKMIDQQKALIDQWKSVLKD
ncbi:MAG: hypothetical protein B7Z75_07285 [Acidocella sp. 20-57-95]|nr:MAG: hypothetical protein B7Z75_07285 [Acidocella sp. 20-57-95]OYV59664.1 MAG: hypothetical protein B7Z71_07605 [Acidocella sp. 21-58-7]HQT63522.1 tripartite tricarboxylate transporter substrate binding protein [Acidocella sp.]HQU03306.1 tripartite tricarboxylate transporter substrate binding protein [Acidocella sp.]